MPGFFAWRSEVDAKAREEKELAAFFEASDQRKGGGARGAKGAAAGDGDELEAGTLDWRGFRRLIEATPQLEALVPSVLGPVLDRTAESHESKSILGWMPLDEFQTKASDVNFSF